MMKLRVVPDTNLFIGARFNPRSSSARILDLCLKGSFRALLSTKVKAEVRSMLGRVGCEGEFKSKVRRLLKEAEEVEVREELPLLMEDPDDNKLLNCALWGKADYLITNDRHLLKFKEYLGVKIRRPSDFLKEWGQAGKGTGSPPNR
ncbi:MAG: putative toxin-antitoxin system toxin component, PIN family [Hadesarchaea archaeon]|jgi:putative PIN family toxin of toxin-antitoxin system|nr:MAG: putative toxin-antitoxin system toxin component, PIN family [Hadesarchaea archaeon]